MKILYLDTSSSFLYTAILENNQLVGERKEKLENKLSEMALPEIYEMLEEASIKPNMIEKVVAVNGPGSFTGIRIGLTIAKTLSWALQIPIISISSLEAMALSDKSNSRYVVPCLDARRCYVYASIYDKIQEEFVMKEQYISLKSLEDFMNKYEGEISYITNDDIKTNYPKNQYQPDIKTIVNKVQNRQATNPHAIDANYLKKTEAEEKHDYNN